MKSITIHGLDATLDRLIRKRAKKQGYSLNRTIKRLLEESLGIHMKKKSDHRDDFLDLFGIWTKKEAEKFSAGLIDLEKIDKEDWR
jgi:hypothetical protein